jgi:hypothetical protein
MIASESGDSQPSPAVSPPAKSGAPIGFIGFRRVRLDRLYAVDLISRREIVKILWLFHVCGIFHKDVNKT